MSNPTTWNYEQLQAVCGTAGLIIMVLFFLGVTIVTFWPGKKAQYDQQAKSILQEDSHA